MKNQDKKNFWSWIKNKIKYSLIAFCIVGVAIVAADEISSNQVPADLQLKAAKEDIVQSFEYAQYEYKKDANGENVLDERGNPIIAKTNQMIGYSYKSEELAPQLPDEVIEKRTENIVTKALGNNQFAAQSGYDFYQENGEWKQIKSATTTKEAFNKTSLLDEFIAWAANTASTSPGTMTDDAATGTVVWDNPNNAKESNDVYATIISGGNSQKSHYLKATNFGFSIPVGSEINGIVVEVERKSSTIWSKDINVRIVKADGVYGTTNKADTVNAWPTSDAYKSYGSSLDLWGETWTSSDINDIDFGMGISAASDNNTGSVDHVRITVYYTEAAGGDISSPVIFKSGAVFRSGVIFK